MSSFTNDYLLELFLDHLDVPEDYPLQLDEFYWLYRQFESMVVNNNFFPWSY
ncbi:hypothetical protein [Sutcliffiella cohnii]|uniref:hypothetical protein n=1 Tax=Sutcliffiella cohnii TaxID=33932 RepID=UPI000AD4B202|nr:hypothetical protein [Sutcliffiella cohnii]MED4015238.1 hypothetical protein [Sutcliffiella cohnii]